MQKIGLGLVPFVLFTSCRASKEPGAPSMNVTLAVVNATVWTGDTPQPWAEAIAVAGERISHVGTNEEIRKVAGAARVIDAGATALSPSGARGSPELNATGVGPRRPEGDAPRAMNRMLVPGFIDSHVHFLDGGGRLASVQLRDARTREEFAKRIGDFAKTVPDGTWILGGDWDHELWGGELPRREWIDDVTPRHPVWVNRLDGHMALANTRALEAAGVTRATKDVSGGTIVWDEKGEPTGILKDNAMGLVWKSVPPPSTELQDRALDAAMRFVAERGVTSVHNMGSWEDLEVFERAHKAGRLTTRIYAAVPLATWERLAQKVAKDGRGDSWLRTGALKGFVDGSLGSHTAAFKEPFTDSPKDAGFFVNKQKDLYAWISAADKAGLHVMVHAIGDRANGTLLDIYERVVAENGPRDRRFRIEHAQHLAPADIARFAKSDVIASMQPYHTIDDGRWAEKVIGPERIKGTYAFRSLLDAGARLAFGSDWFVAPPTPLEGIYAAVTRRTLDDKNPEGWVPEQKISVEEAIAAYTRTASFASFEESVKGTLSPGKVADFVLLDRNITTIPAEEIRDVKVLLTVVGGKVVFERIPP